MLDLWACLQVYVPYNVPYTLPIPATAHPSAVTTAPNVSYPPATCGVDGLMTLANTVANFGLRFTGENSGILCLEDQEFGEFAVLCMSCAGSLHAALKCVTRKNCVTRCRLPTAGSQSFAGSIKIPGSKPTNYTFLLDSDDGAVLYIDGKLVISHKGAQHSGRSPYRDVC